MKNKLFYLSIIFLLVAIINVSAYYPNMTIDLQTYISCDTSPSENKIGGVPITNKNVSLSTTKIHGANSCNFTGLSQQGFLRLDNLSQFARKQNSYVFWYRQSSNYIPQTSIYSVFDNLSTSYLNQGIDIGSTTSPYVYNSNALDNLANYKKDGNQGLFTWVFIAVTLDSGGRIVNFYIGSSAQSSFSNGGSIDYTNLNTFIIGAGGVGTNNPRMFFDGQIDEFMFWNKTLTVSEITQLYNSGTGLFYDDFIAPPSTNFNTQEPSDINSGNAFGIVNISYSINGTGLTSRMLNYQVNNSVTNKLIYENGSVSNTYKQVTYNYNVNDLYYYQLKDNQYLPAIYIYPEYKMENKVKSEYLLNNANSRIRCQFDNVTQMSQPFGFYEANINTTGNGYSLYYTNSSSQSSLFFDTLIPINSNHTHNQSEHWVYSFPIINNKINNVGVTNTGFIEIVGRSGSNTKVRYVPDSSSDICQYSVNNGVTWNNLGYVDNHLHFFSNTTQLNYYVSVIDGTGSYYNSSLRSDLIELVGGLPPTSSIITPVSNNIKLPKTYTFTWEIGNSPHLAVVDTVNFSIYRNDSTLFYTSATTSETATFILNETGEFFAAVYNCDINNLCSLGTSNLFNISSAYVPTTLINNLVAYYPMDNDCVTDVWNNYNAYFSSTPHSLINHIVGNGSCMLYNTEDRQIKVKNLPVLSDISIIFFMDNTDLTDNYYYELYGSTTGNFIKEKSNHYNRVYSYSTGISNSLDSTTYNIGSTRNIVSYSNGKIVSYYINNVSQGNSELETFSHDMTNLIIGCDKSGVNCGSGSNRYIDDFIILNRSITQDDADYLSNPNNNLYDYLLNNYQYYHLTSNLSSGIYQDNYFYDYTIASNNINGACYLYVNNTLNASTVYNGGTQTASFTANNGYYNLRLDCTNFVDTEEINKNIYMNNTIITPPTPIIPSNTTIAYFNATEIKEGLVESSNIFIYSLFTIFGLILLLFGFFLLELNKKISFYLFLLSFILGLISWLYNIESFKNFINITIVLLSIYGIFKSIFINKDNEYI